MDAQVPGVNGTTLPPDLDHGTALVIASQPALIAADMTYDDASHTAHVCSELCNSTTMLRIHCGRELPREPFLRFASYFVNYSGSCAQQLNRKWKCVFNFCPFPPTPGSCGRVRVTEENLPRPVLGLSIYWVQRSFFFTTWCFNSGHILLNHNPCF